jgi:hypothetical protein
MFLVAISAAAAPQLTYPLSFGGGTPTLEV